MTRREFSDWAKDKSHMVVREKDKARVIGASTDLVPDLQHRNDPVPLLKDQIDRLHIGGSGG